MASWRTSPPESRPWSVAWQAIDIPDPLCPSLTPSIAETRAETAEAERRVIAQCDSLAHEVVSATLDEAKDSLAAYSAQIQDQAQELVALQRSMETNHAGLRAEVGDQIAACRDAVLSRVELASQAVRTCESQATAHNHAMASQLEAGLAMGSHDTRAVVEELRERLAEAERQRHQAQQAMQHDAEAAEARVEAEVSRAAAEMAAEASRCGEAVESQRRALEELAGDAAKWKARLEERYEEKVSACEETMGKELSRLELEFSQRLQAETSAREAQATQAAHEARKLRDAHEAACHQVSQLTIDLQREVELCEERIMARVGREAETIGGEIREAGEALAEQALALKQMCSQTGIQFRSGANAVRAASPTRERPRGGARAPRERPEALRT